MAKRYICPKCENIGLPAKKKRGSAGAEMFAWMVFPLGVPYTIWRMFSKIPVCKMCGHEPLINEESLIGQKLVDKIYGLDAPIKNPKPLQLPIKKMTRPAPAPTIAEQPAEPRPRMDTSRPEKNPEQF